METLIRNQSVLTGDYDNGELEVLSTIAEVTLVEGLDATKTADRQYWSGGDLVYTVLIENTTDVDYENPEFSDTLDALMVYVDQSFKVDGADHPATFTAGVLTSTLPTIIAGGTLTITFTVNKA